MKLSPIFSLLAAAATTSLVSAKLQTFTARDLTEAQALVFSLAGRDISTITPAEKRQTSSDPVKPGCGAILSVPQGVSGAIANFTAPKLSLRPGLPPVQAVSAWLGVDAVECFTGFIQTGVETLILPDETQVSYAWVRYGNPVTFRVLNLLVNPGDVVFIDLLINSPTEAFVVFSNLSTKTAAQVVQIELTTGALCRNNVEWFVEGYSYVRNELLPFAKFQTEVFFNATANANRPQHVGISGAGFVDVFGADGTNYCSVKDTNDSSFAVTSL